MHFAHFDKNGKEHWNLTIKIKNYYMVFAFLTEKSEIEDLLK